MIDIDRISRVLLLLACAVFFGLWRWSEQNTREALYVAARTVETTGACIASYRDSERKMGAAVQGLTTMLRTQ